MNKKSPFMIFHTVLMAMMILCSIGGTINFIVEYGKAVSDKDKTQNLMSIFMMLVIVAMLITGVLYLAGKYGKKAAGFYKAFLLLQVAVACITLVIDILFTDLDAMMIGKCVMYGCKIIILLILSLAKDLGLKRSWMLFYALLFTDIASLVFTVIHMINTSFDFSLMGAITAITAAITTGLAIRGKYMDKEERGTS